MTFLRGWWPEAAAGFLWVEVLDLCVLLDFCAVVADEDFFFGAVEVLSCPNNPLPWKSNRKARKIAAKRRVLTLFSVARFLLPAFMEFRYRIDSYL